MPEGPSKLWLPRSLLVKTMTGAMALALPTLAIYGVLETRLLVGLLISSSVLLCSFCDATSASRSHFIVESHTQVLSNLFFPLMSITMILHTLVLGPGRGLGIELPLHAVLALASSTVLLVVCIVHLKRLNTSSTSSVPAPFPFLFFLLLVSSIWAPDPARSFGYLFHFFTYGITLLLTLRQGRLRTNLYGFAVFLISAIGILSGYHLVELFFSRDNLRLSFFAGDPNRTSLLTCVALCLSCVVLKARGKPLILKVWLSGTILFNSLALAFSHSRGSFIALMIFIVLYTQRTFARILVILLSSFFVWIPSFSKYIRRNQTIGDFLSGTGRVDQITGSIKVYSDVFAEGAPVTEAEGAPVTEIAQRPGLLETLFGHGLGSARDVLQPSTGLGSGHNAYLDILIEVGVVGILLLMSALFATSRVLAPHIQAGDRRPAISVSCFFLISGMVTSSFGRPGPETFLAFIAFSVSLGAVWRPRNLDPRRQGRE